MADSVPPSSANDARATRAGNVYHKNPRGPRARREPVHRVDSAGEAPPRRSAQGNPVQVAMAQNVRRFLVFSISMAIIFYLSIKGLFMVWQAKDKEMWSSSAPPPPAATDDETNDVPETGTADSAVKGGSALDRDSIRKAVFLAKRAKTLAESGKNAEAIERYNEALDVWPYLGDVWPQLGRLYLKVKNYPKAQAALERAVENNSTSAETLNDMGVAYLYTGQREKALKAFEVAMEVDADFAPSYFNMALCHLAGGERKDARDYFDQYLRMRPGDPRALRETAFLDAAARNYPDAMKALEKAIVEAPDWPLLYFDAAATAALMGQADQAIKYLQRAEPLSTPSAVYRQYQEPAFKNIRDSDVGHDFERELIARTKDTLNKTPAPTSEPTSTSSEPLSSVTPEI